MDNSEDWWDNDTQIDALHLKFDVVVVTSNSTPRFSILEDFTTFINFLLANTTLQIEVEVNTQKWLRAPRNYLWQNEPFNRGYFIYQFEIHSFQNL